MYPFFVACRIFRGIIINFHYSCRSIPPLIRNRLAVNIFQYPDTIVRLHPSESFMGIVFFICQDCYKMIAVVDSGCNGPCNVRNGLIVGIQPYPPLIGTLPLFRRLSSLLFPIRIVYDIIVRRPYFPDVRPDAPCHTMIVLSVGQRAAFVRRQLAICPPLNGSFGLHINPVPFLSWFSLWARNP